MVIFGRFSGSDVNSSYVMEGMVDYLLEGLEYESVKKNIHFYFVPLVNIDGVRFGSSLTNLTGSDLRQCWKQPHKLHHAEIYCLKEFLVAINK